MVGMRFPGAFAICGVVVAGTVFATVLVNKKHPETPTSAMMVSVMKAQYDTVGQQVLAEGNIVPYTSAIVSALPNMTGRATSVNVDVGDHVTQGQILAVLEPDTATYDYASSASAVQAARAKLQLTEHPFTHEQLEEKRLMVEGDVRAIDEANEHLQELKNGSRPQEITAATAAVASEQTKLNLSQAQFARMQDLYTKDLAPKADLDMAQAQVAIDQSGLAQAQQQLSLLQEGPRTEEIQIAQSAVDRAKLTYGSDEQGYKVMLSGSRPEEIAQAADALQTASIAQSQKSNVLARRYIRAPISGVITGRYINPGEVAVSDPIRVSEAALFSNNAKGLFTIADDTKMNFLANVDQQYFSSMHEGQRAQVTVESMPGRVFSGKVVRITPIINPDLGRRGSSVAVNPSSPFTFNVWVTIPNPGTQLLPGQLGQMSMSLPLHGVIVPASALTPYSLGSGMVYTERNGVVHSRTIRYTGAADGKVRILSGLKAGEYVVVSPITNLQMGVPITPVVVNSDYLIPQKG